MDRSMSLECALNEFLSRYSSAGRDGGGSRVAYSRAVKEFLSVSGIQSWVDITQASLSLYAGKLIESGMRDSTLKMRSQGVRAFLRFASDHGCVDSALDFPLMGLDPTGSRRVQRSFALRIPSVNELLMSGIEGNIMIATALSTGLRPLEVLSVKWGDITPDKSGGASIWIESLDAEVPISAEIYSKFLMLETANTFPGMREQIRVFSAAGRRQCFDYLSGAFDG